ncbi:hypothetical protein PBOI14_28060 [Pseudomonas sp. Boi14]|nr:hypothetical protein PBOI14_28060 [Pseudomonas sp. Boi14]
MAWLYGVQPPAMGLLAALPALLLVALMLSALGLLLSNAIRQLENFAGVMNFVIFPLFFLSSALYPLWKMLEASPWLYWLCALNPFTHAVELVRFALYERLNLLALAVCLGLTLVFSLLAVLTFNPSTPPCAKAPPRFPRIKSLCSRCRALGEAAKRAAGPSSDPQTGTLQRIPPWVALMDRAGRFGVSCGAGRSLRQRLHEAFCALQLLQLL